MAEKKEKTNKEPTTAEIKEILRLPEGPEGDEMLNKRLSAFNADFTEKEKLFVLFYASPNSKYCGKISKAGEATGGCWRGYGSWALQQPHVKNAVRELTKNTMLDTLEEFFREDIKRNLDVITLDRSSLRKDTEFTFKNPNTGEDVTVEKIKEKSIYELSKKQRDAIADYEPDKNGDLHPVIESRAQARQNLINYYKILGLNKSDDEPKTTETVVTLEAIKDKTIAKVQVIQKNNEDAIKAGDFIQRMSEQDEEA